MWQKSTKGRKKVAKNGVSAESALLLFLCLLATQSFGQITFDRQIISGSYVFGARQ